MNLSDLGAERYYTVDEWSKLPDVLRTELYDGKIELVSMPTPAQQMVSLRLTLQIGGFLGGKPFHFFHAPIGVRLFNNRDIIVGPDALIVFDTDKIGERMIVGAPDLVVEILSSKNTKNEKIDKLYLYYKAGVREYWIISIESKIVFVYFLRNNEYTLRVYSLNDGDMEFRVGVLPEMTINLQNLFGVSI